MSDRPAPAGHWFPAPLLTVSRTFGGSAELGRRLLLHDDFLKRLARACSMLPVCAEDLVTLDAATLVDGVLVHERDRPPMPLGEAAIEDQHGLRDTPRRRAFLTLLFALARLRHVHASGSRARLVELHARYKYLLMAHGAAHATALGRIVAGLAARSWDATTGMYRAGLVRALRAPAGMPATINALEHVFGYVSSQLDAGARADFGLRLDSLRAGEAALATCSILCTRG